jgi:hypothetical protein
MTFNTAKRKTAIEVRMGSEERKCLRASSARSDSAMVSYSTGGELSDFRRLRNR